MKLQVMRKLKKKSFARPANPVVKTKNLNPSSVATALQSSEVILLPLSEETLYERRGKKHQQKRKLKKKAFARPANQVVRSKNQIPSSEVTALQLSEVILPPLLEETL